MKQKTFVVIAALTLSLVTSNILAQDLPDTYWSQQQASEILDKTRRVFLDPDLSALTSGEQAAVSKLIEAGHIMNQLYEDSMHPQALVSKHKLQALHQDGQHTQSLLDLYYMAKGPIASTLDNRRVPFLPVAAEAPGKNVYPVGMSREKMDPLLAARPELAAGLLDVRTVVRESSEKNLKHDLATLDRYPMLDGLPLGAGRKIQQDIPVGVYNIIADFGQSRGSNTATILPNDANHSRKYGRTILLRYNIMTHPDLFNDAKEKYKTAVAPEFADDLSLEGPFYRTLWHEVGHYLGVDSTEDGRGLNEALSPWGSHYEEMKADLVSLFTSAQMNRDGQMSDELLRSVQAGGIYRVLQNNQPRTADQPYQTMQLMQMNYFLEQGLLTFDDETARLSINYDLYESVATKLLGEVLAIQSVGDSDRATTFIKRYTSWTPEVHEMLAERLRNSAKYRYRMVGYKALQ